MTTHADPQGRPTIFGALPKDLPRLISVGRLDLNTEGLLLLTNDGGLARALELPATGWLRRYRVRAHGTVTQAQLDALRNGITVDGVRYGPIEATLDREQGTNVWLTFAIREGKNREVRNVLGHLGLAVNRLIRVSFGPFQLGELAEGRGRGGARRACCASSSARSSRARRARISPRPIVRARRRRLARGDARSARASKRRGAPQSAKRAREARQRGMAATARRTARREKTAPRAAPSARRRRAARMSRNGAARAAIRAASRR